MVIGRLYPIGAVWMILFSLAFIRAADHRTAKHPLLPFQNVATPVDQRVADLLARMTVEEKDPATGHVLGEGSGEYERSPGIFV